MGEFQYKAGLNHVGSYQISSIPYMSSSIMAPIFSDTPLEIVFPSITKTVTVKNETSVGAAARLLRFGISSNGVKNTNYIKLNNGEAFSLDIRVSKIYLISDNSLTVEASVYAGLTGIENNNLPNNWSGSIGVG